MKASGLRGKPVLGANLDPSHFFWQGIDPILAAKDTAPSSGSRS